MTNPAPATTFPSVHFGGPKGHSHVAITRSDIELYPEKLQKRIRRTDAVITKVLLRKHLPIAVAAAAILGCMHVSEDKGPNGRPASANGGAIGGSERHMLVECKDTGH